MDKDRDEVKQNELREVSESLGAKQKSPEDLCQVTDMFLGHITFAVLEGSEKERKEFFTFLKSRPILFIGSEQVSSGEFTIVLKEEGVAPCHASIRWQNGKFFFRVEESSGETLFNEQPVQVHAQMQLTAEGSIKLGACVLQYQLKTLGMAAPPD